jgi:signal peptidase I
MDKKTILKYVKSFLFYFFVGYLVLYISLQIIAPKTTIKILQTKPFVVETGSMSPLININDMVIARNFNLEKLNIGDIIVFTTDIDPWLNNGTETVTHYIHDIYEEEGIRKYKTIRHNGNLPDSWVLEDQDILGLYWFHIPKIGTVQRFFQSPFGIATIAVNAIIIGVIIYIVKTDKKDKATDIKA